MAKQKQTQARLVRLDLLLTQLKQISQTLESLGNSENMKLSRLNIAVRETDVGSQLERSVMMLADARDSVEKAVKSIELI